MIKNFKRNTIKRRMLLLPDCQELSRLLLILVSEQETHGRMRDGAGKCTEESKPQKKWQREIEQKLKKKVEKDER